MRYFRPAIAESIASGLPGDDEQHVAEQPQRRLGVEQTRGERDQWPSPPRRSRRGRVPGGGACISPPATNERPEGLAEDPGGIVRMRGAHRAAAARERRRQLGARAGALAAGAAAPCGPPIAAAAPASR